jgi:hypothetical protein
MGVLVAAGVVTVSSSATTRPHPQLSEQQILRIALKAAVALGDPRPTLIQHSEGTNGNANQIASGDSTGGSAWSYLIAERGNFVFKDAPRPLGAAAPRGTVITIVVDAASGRETDGGISSHYPRLRRLGPVTTDYRTYLSCPAKDRRQLISTAPGATQDLVPPGARQVLVCRYGGLNSGREKTRLVSINMITDRAAVLQLAQRIDALKPLQSGAYSCPADFGMEIIAIFRYLGTRSSDDPVTIDPDGCAPVSNGRVLRTALLPPGPALIGELEALTSKRHS